MIADSTPARVLVVDDNPTSLLLLRTSLENQGLHVCAVENAEVAEALVAADKKHPFDCLVTDLWMPGRNGIDLLRSVRVTDPDLSVVVVTGAGERDMIMQSLRFGACDFLNKPVAIPDFQNAVARAVETTRDRRHLAETVSAAREIGRLQQVMLGMGRSADGPPIEMRCFPKSEAGGDSLNCFRLSPEEDFVLMTDVSGHDLRAAFVSAYFQGIVRGMLEQRVPVPEVFAYFSRLLLNEWSQVDSGGYYTGLAASVAASSLKICHQKREVTILTSGAPLPVYVDGQGAIQYFGQEGTYPLGWFADDPLCGSQYSVAEGGSIFVWTDGLEILAETREVSPLALATTFILGVEEKPPQNVFDDILVARVGVERKPVADAHLFYPILRECYPGDKAGAIDRFQESWRRSLLCAIPSLSEEDLYGILLSAREAMLNGLKHGCGGACEQHAVITIAYAPGPQLLRMVVSDPGAGHGFQEHEREVQPSDMEEDLLPAHRGLLMMRHLCSSLELRRGGAEVHMDFQLNQTILDS